MTAHRVHAETAAHYRSWRSAMARQYFAPRTVQSPSAWVEANRELGPPSMSEGPFRWSETPYLKPIFDAFWSPGFTEGAVAKASQVGYTDGLLMNIIAYAACERPSSIAMLLPSDLFAEDFSKDKIEPLLEHTDIVRQFFSSVKLRDRDATLLNKKMKSGHRLRLFGANSIARLKSFGSQVRLLDEIDEFENDEKQGDPEKLLDRAAYRAAAGSARKLKGGTPTMHPSRIWKAFLAGNQQRLHVTCPVCRQPFFIRWKENVTWPRTTEHHPEGAQLRCNQGHDIPQALTASLIRAGEFVALAPTAPTPSWHIPGMISLSPSMTLGTIAKEFLEAGKDPMKLKVVFNTMFGEAFEDRRDRIVVSALRDRRERYAAEVPRGAGLLTLAVDVQRAPARLEVLLVGWGANEESWRIHHWRLEGEIKQLEAPPGQDPSPWQRLEALWKKWYVHEAGVALRPSLMGIDSADGEMTDLVYKFVKPRQDAGAIALRGEKEFRGVTRRSRMAEMVKPGMAKDSGVRLQLMNTYALKDRLFARLRPDEELARMHFPWFPDDSTEFDSVYFQQFGNEARQDVPTHKGSSETMSVYVKTGPNEAIDLEVQSMATLYSAGADRVAQLASIVTEVQARGAAAQHSADAARSPAPTSRRPSTPGFHRPR